METDPLVFIFCIVPAGILAFCLAMIWLVITIGFIVNFLKGD